ncbi:MAG: type II secretion system minor pseudopilin GspI [Sphingomonadaceae bacterium]|nr:type II secretion system minor pseudopilin GspI [Sphingomonadaceae bacterium]
MSRADPRQCEAGFTLLEMLVALAVFSIAALALLNLETVTLTNTTRIADRTIGQIVARNIAVEALTDPAPPAQGSEDGEEANGGRTWRWTRFTSGSPEPRILQIDVAIENELGDTVATLTVFRFAPT